MIPPQYDSDETVIDEEIHIPPTAYDEVNATVDMSQADDVINRLFNASFPENIESNENHQFNGMKLSAAILAFLELDKTIAAPQNLLNPPTLKLKESSKLEKNLNNQTNMFNIPSTSNSSVEKTPKLMELEKVQNPIQQICKSVSATNQQAKPSFPTYPLEATKTKKKKRSNSGISIDDTKRTKPPKKPPKTAPAIPKLQPKPNPAPATTTTSSATSIPTSPSTVPSMNRAEIFDVAELIRMLSGCYIRPNRAYLAANFNHSELRLLLSHCGDIVPPSTNLTVSELAQKLSWLIKTGAFCELRGKFI
jgi:hypothetical protein